MIEKAGYFGPDGTTFSTSLCHLLVLADVVFRFYKNVFMFRLYKMLELLPACVNSTKVRRKECYHENKSRLQKSYSSFICLPNDI